MICILYVTTITVLLALAAWLTERALPSGAPRRWVWCITITLSVLIPPVYIALHQMPVGGEEARAGVGIWASLDTMNVMLPWQIGSIGLVLLAALHVWRIQRVTRGPSILIDEVPVVVTRSAGPATVGVFKPRVVVPQWVLALPDLERRYVIQHEDEHRRARDARMLFLTSILLVVTPWNVALWWQIRRLALAVEMDCDGRVLRKLGDADRYGRLLLAVAEANCFGPRIQPGLVGGPGSLEQRLRHMLVPQEWSVLLRIGFACAALVLLYLVLTLPHPVLAGGIHDVTTTVHQ
jgi:bla regulator protein blaR1